MSSSAPWRSCRPRPHGTPPCCVRCQFRADRFEFRASRVSARAAHQYNEKKHAMSDESVPSTPRSFDITQTAGRNLVRREIIKLFRTTELAPRDILQRLLEHFYGASVSAQDRLTFLRH